MNNAVMKDTSLFDESDGCLQVLCHTKVQHDAWQPPPAGETRLMTYDHIQWLHVNITCLWDDLPAERRSCDFLCEGQILFGGNETNTVPTEKKRWNYRCDVMILKLTKVVQNSKEKQNIAACPYRSLYHEASPALTSSMLTGWTVKKLLINRLC